MVMTLPKIRNRRTPQIHILESRARAVFGMLNFHPFPEGIRMTQESPWVLQDSRSRDEAGARSNTYVAGRRRLAALHAGVGIAQLTTLGVNYERHHHTSRFQSGTKLVAHAAARHSSHRIRGPDIRVAGNIPGFTGAAVRRLLLG